jgi:hypothetical protein
LYAGITIRIRVSVDGFKGDVPECWRIVPEAAYATGVIAVLAAAALTCAGALIIGQAACWICGARAWTFQAAPVGLALMMLISVAAIHVPGHTATIAVLLLLLCLAGIALLIRAPEIRPRPSHLLVAGPTFLLALLPFVANGRAGTLGVSFDNDMATHLRWAEAILSPAVASVSNIDSSYPIGPHALCAVLAKALGTRVDYAFAGETLALPVLIAWTTVSALRRVGWTAKAFVATMVALTFLVAGYYGQGSFKELMQALFVLAFALGLEQLFSEGGVRRLRWVPLALIVGGSLSCYSVAGLPWFLAILGLSFFVLGVSRAVRGRPLRVMTADVVSQLQPILIALGVLLILLVPQLPRLVRFYESNVGVGGGTGISTSSLGNLAGPVVFWKVFGIWDNADYRLEAINPLHAGVLAGCVLIAALIGLVWWTDKVGWVVPLTAVLATAIWAYSDRNQSPYVAAKALVVLAPLIMILATRWLVELRAGEAWLSSLGMLRIGVVVLFAWAALGTSVKALRYAFVAPTAHVDDLRSLQPTLGRSRTLFLGWDDFIGWELAGTPVDQPYLGYLHFSLNPQKAWQPGQPLDFDDIPPEVLDRYRFVVGPRDAAGSQAPSDMKLIRTSRYYEVWERVGPAPHRLTLQEGQEPGAVLDCTTAAGRAIASRRGSAAVRSPNVSAPVPPIAPGSKVAVSLALTPGRWQLTAPYTSPHPISVSAPGFHTVVPANLDRPGNRWPLGEIVTRGHGPTIVTLQSQASSLTGPALTETNELVATPVTAERIIPLHQACGRYVDWYVLG